MSQNTNQTSFCPEFDTLLGCPDELRQRILREISPQFLALALMGAGEQVREYLLEPLTAAERQALEDARPWYPRRIDVKAEQQNILREIQSWKEDGSCM